MKPHSFALIALPALVAAIEGGFRSFFPLYNSAFQHILEEKCHNELLYYRKAKTLEDLDDDASRPTIRGNWTVGDLTRDFGYNAPENFVVECILGATPEVIKSKMGTSQVLLGLTPSLLALLAPGQHQNGLVAIAAGNPLLATFLAAASPIVSPIQSLDYTKSVDIITTRRLEVPGFCRSHATILIVVEYIIVFGCIGNTAEVGVRLFRKVMFSFNLSGEWYIFLWFFFGILVHVLGAYAVSTRVKVVRDAESESKFSFVRRCLQRFHIFRRPKHLQLKIVQESFVFYVVSWIASVSTVCHLIYGTLIFSSVLFISIEDSAVLLARLMLSVVFCKIVIMYELFYLQGVVTVTEEHSGGIQPKFNLKNHPSQEYSGEYDPHSRIKY